MSKEIFIEKRDGERVRIGRGEYNGHEYIDIRLQFKNQDGNWKPTSKGCTLPLDKLAELKAAVAKFEI